MHRAPRSLIAVLSACGLAAAQWQQPSLTTSPGPLVGPAMAGNLNGTILLSGGDTGSFPAGLTTASWLYAQGAWQPVASTGPSGRTETGASCSEAFSIEAIEYVGILAGVEESFRFTAI